MTTTKRTQRPILHVKVVSYDHLGNVLKRADIDGVSTADALAYFLTSRGYDPSATEDSILTSKSWDHPNLRPPGPRETLVAELRDPVSGALTVQVKAEVH